MISVSIPNSEFKKLKNQLGVFKKEAKIRIMQEVDKAAAHVRETAEMHIQANGSTVNGTLARSLTILRQPAYLKARVFTNAGYGKFVEYGRKPGRMPPPNKMAEWVRQKGISSTYNIQTQKIRRSRSKATKNLERQLGWAIAKKIGREGTKAQPFMEPAMRSGVRMLNRGMKNIVRGI